MLEISMSRFNDRVISNFGQLLKQQGLAPSNSLYTNGLSTRNKTIHRIGNRYLDSCFLLQRGGLHSVYVNPTYRSYRPAFKEALNVDVSDADIDHYFAKAAAKLDMQLDGEWRKTGEQAASPEGRIFLVLGALPPSVNRSMQDNTDLGTMMTKLVGQKSLDTDVKTVIGMSNFDDPAFAVKILSTGFQVPRELVRWSNINPVTADTLKGREKEIFAAYIEAKAAE
jgi:hypothetical protein